MSLLPSDKPVVVIERPLSAIERLRAVVSMITFPLFPMPLRIWVEDSPLRVVREQNGLPPEGLVQLLVEVKTRPRPFDSDPLFVSREGYGIIFNKGIEHYTLSKLSDLQMAMLVREHVILAVVHEIDEHMLFNGARLFDPHPYGPGSFEEGPWPQGVWRGRRISSR